MWTIIEFSIEEKLITEISGNYIKNLNKKKSQK